MVFCCLFILTVQECSIVRILLSTDFKIQYFPGAIHQPGTTCLFSSWSQTQQAFLSLFFILTLLAFFICTCISSPLHFFAHIVQLVIVLSYFTFCFFLLFLLQFFSSVMVDGQTSESELSDRLYDILFELHSIEPNILFSVLPQLEYKLLVINVYNR